MEPVKTDLNPAQEWLLQVVRCNCKLSTRRPYGSRSCSCRKKGLNCVPACGGCHGERCENSAEPMHETQNENSDENERNIFDMLESFLQCFVLKNIAYHVVKKDLYFQRDFCPHSSIFILVNK